MKVILVDVPFADDRFFCFNEADFDLEGAHARVEASYSLTWYISGTESRSNLTISELKRWVEKRRESMWFGIYHCKTYYYNPINNKFETFDLMSVDSSILNPF